MFWVQNCQIAAVLITATTATIPTLTSINDREILSDRGSASAG